MKKFIANKLAKKMKISIYNFFMPSSAPVMVRYLNHDCQNLFLRTLNDRNRGEGWKTKPFRTANER